MTKLEIDERLDQWVSKLPKGSGRRYYSKPSPISDGELQYIIRQATIANSRPISYQKELITQTLHPDYVSNQQDPDLVQLGQLLESFEKEYEEKLKKQNNLK